MTKRRVIVVVGVVIVAALLAAAIATAGGIVGYVVARRSLAVRLPWRLYQREGLRLKVPFFLPPPENRGQWFVILPFGAQVTWVEEGSPAEEAGIEVGDIITAVEGVEIDEDHPLQDLVVDYEPGDKITLTLTRRGESREIQVTLGETTDEEGKTIPHLGVRYWSMRRRLFQPQRFDRSRLTQPNLSLLANSAPPS